ncbi:MAG: hypothetical protein LC104_08310 [Bacteroidales bacterium]|nr:hypothetical protein [Bacteroidales bacterium]
MSDSCHDEEDEERTEDSLSSLPPAELELPLTELRVDQGELIRTFGGESVVMRLTIKDIDRVTAGRIFDSQCIVYVLASCGLLAMGFLLVEDRWLVISLCLLGLICGLQAISRMWCAMLTVRFRNEEVVIWCSDPSDVVAGFAATLRSRIES